MPDAPWIKSYPSPARWDAPLALGPVHEILDTAAAQFGDRPAVEFMGKRATYRQLLALANRAAKGFQQLGVGPGVHVGLYLPNTPHYLVAFFGILKAGGTVVNYSPLDAAQVLAHKVEDSETSILVTLDLPMLLPQMEPLVGTRSAQNARRRRPRRLAAAFRSSKARSRRPRPSERARRVPRAARQRRRVRAAPDRRSRARRSRCCSTPAARRGCRKARCSRTAT